jgi:hypothetical protein|tara:strand:- start:714 stop:1172 length:459 start_codon:yes stop_codon:yes gene_type:complete
MSKLTVNESSGDFTHVLTLSAQDIVNASTNQTVWGKIPAGGAVDVAFAVESVALVGATDITLEVGTGTDDDGLIDSFDIDGNNGATVYNSGTDFVKSAATTTIKGGATPVVGSGGASGTNLIYKFGGTVANLTDGEVIIGVRIFDPMRFSGS